MSRRFFIAGLIFGLLGVVLGAFAAHGLKPHLSAEAVSTFETGVKYQMYHALLLLFVGFMGKTHSALFHWIFYLLVFGIIFFSGSIFLLATNSLTGVDFMVLGPVTPIGGSMLIFCWGLLLFHFIKLKNK